MLFIKPSATTTGMSTDSAKPFRFRISLRGLLIALVVFGAGIGVLGRLFRHDPDLFAVVLSVLSTIVPFVLAIGTIIRLGIKHRQSGLWLWGITLIVIPFIGLGVIGVSRMFVGTSPNNLAMQSTSVLINQQLPKQLDAPWVWRELEKRVAAGTLSNNEAEAAVGQLIAHMKATKPQGWDQPLSWQQGFLASVRRKGLLSDSVTFEFCDAFYGPEPTVSPLRRLREGTSQFDLEVEYGSPWSTHTGLDLTLLWHIDQVLLDGTPLKVEQRYKNRDRGSWSGSHSGVIPIGDHQVTLEMTCAYVDGAKLIGLDNSNLPPTRWPKTAQRWKRTISIPLKVFTADETIVALTTDTNLDPTSQIQVKRCVIQADKGTKNKVIVELSLDTTVAMSCDVSITLAGTNIPLGSRWVALREGGRSSGGNNLTAIIESLDPVIEYADIILTPAPEHIEHRAEVKEIWGKPIKLFSVPVERLDLEVQPTRE